jgi:hypothetical protein
MDLWGLLALLVVGVPLWLPVLIAVRGFMHGKHNDAR